MSQEATTYLAITVVVIVFLSLGIGLVMTLAELFA